MEHAIFESIDYIFTVTKDPRQWNVFFSVLPCTIQWINLPIRSGEMSNFKDNCLDLTHANTSERKRQAKITNRKHVAHS